jgi:NTE family protein
LSMHPACCNVKCREGGLKNFMFRRQMALFVATLTIALSSLQAQNPQPRRQVIGIALSGGGALGLAHIGVLRYMEEHRIPLDRIVGTSMGGLLGGLYATGHSAADLEKIVREADWDDLLRTTPEFEDRPVIEKQEWNRITGQFSLQLGKGFALPAGLNRGQALALLLSGETAAYSDVRDFDNLPIPFRCVATDLVSGEAFVLSEGDLPKAMRATMAIPGIFTPVDWNDLILSDGGLVNNLPTDVVKQMGADVVIAVTLRVAPAGAQELNTLLNILRQSVNIAVLQNEFRNVKLADIDVAVQLGNRGLLDFADTKSIIELGYMAAAQNQALEKLSVSQEQWDEYIRARRAKERTSPDSGPLLDVSSAQPSIRRNALSELRRKTGPVVSRSRLEDNLSGLTAATGLPNAFYGWHTPAQGNAGYKVELETRHNSEILVRPSFFYGLSPDEPSRATFRLSSATIFKDAYKSRLLADLYLGGDPGMFVEYYHPFGGSAYFIAPGGSVERDHNFIYDGKTRTDQTRDRFAASLYFGIGTWRHLQLRAGAQAGIDKYSNAVIANGLVPSDTLFVNPEIKATINAQDSGQLPSRGFRLNVSAGRSFREHSYPYLQLNFDHFQPFGEDVSAFAVGQVSSGMGRKLTFYDQFTTGGLTQLDAYRYQELRGDTVLMGGVGVLYRGANPNNAVFRPIFGSWYEAAGLDSFSASARSRHSGTIGMFAPTPLGLAGLTFSVDFKGATRFRLSIGSFWNRP